MNGGIQTAAGSSINAAEGWIKILQRTSGAEGLVHGADGDRTTIGIRWIDWADRAGNVDIRVRSDPGRAAWTYAGDPMIYWLDWRG